MIIMGAKAILSSKGQVVIPKAMRDKLGLHSGIELTIGVKKESGIIELKPVRRKLQDFFGMGKLNKQAKANKKEDVDELIAKAVTENDRY